MATSFTRFASREAAGELLADTLIEQAPATDLVLAIPRGGIAVGLPVARRFGVPLLPVLVRKLGYPFNPEAAFGAVAEDGAALLPDPEDLAVMGISPSEAKAIVQRELGEIARRRRFFGGPDLARVIPGRTVALVDDGLATGSTMLCAARLVRRHMPARLVIGIPCGATDSVERLRAECDRMVCLIESDEFWAVSLWYEDFRQVSDEEARALLQRAPPLQPPAMTP